MPNKSKITEIHAEAGISWEQNGVWYKAMYGETVDVSNLSPEEIKSERHLTWKRIGKELQKQYESK